MVNRIMFWGQIVEILFSSNKKIEFVMENKNTRHRATITTYDDDLFQFIQVGKSVTISGEFYEVPGVERNYIIRANKIVPYKEEE